MIVRLGRASPVRRARPDPGARWWWRGVPRRRWDRSLSA